MLLFQVLKQLISLVESPDEFAWKGYFFSALLLIIYCTSTIFFTTYLVHMYCVAITVRIAYITLGILQMKVIIFL